MIKQVKFFLESSINELEAKINNFCLDFFPDEIFSITIKEISGGEWLGYVVYQREYDDVNPS